MEDYSDNIIYRFIDPNVVYDYLEINESLNIYIKYYRTSILTCKGLLNGTTSNKQLQITHPIYLIYNLSKVEFNINCIDNNSFVLNEYFTTEAYSGRTNFIGFFMSNKDKSKKEENIKTNARMYRRGKDISDVLRKMRKIFISQINKDDYEIINCNTDDVTEYKQGTITKDRYDTTETRETKVNCPNYNNSEIFKNKRCPSNPNMILTEKISKNDDEVDIIGKTKIRGYIINSINMTTYLEDSLNIDGDINNNYDNYSSILISKICTEGIDNVIKNNIININDVNNERNKDMLLYNEDVKIIDNMSKTYKLFYHNGDPSYIKALKELSENNNFILLGDSLTQKNNKIYL